MRTEQSTHISFIDPTPSQPHRTEFKGSYSLVLIVRFLCLDVNHLFATIAKAAQIQAAAAPQILNIRLCADGKIQALPRAKPARRLATSFSARIAGRPLTDSRYISCAREFGVFSLFPIGIR